MRLLITVPWNERLGGAETMLQMMLDGSVDTPHEVELVFLETGPWPKELAEAGFRVTVLPAGRMRQAHRWASTVVRMARLFRSRRPDLILNWASKTHLYSSPAAILAGMGDRVVWWQHVIPRRGGDVRNWIDIAARLLPAQAVGCTSQSAAEAQGRLWPSRPTFVVHGGAAEPRPSADRAKLRLPDDRLVLGLVGRLQPWKGQDRFLRAQGLLRDRGHAVHSLLVGGDAYGMAPDYAGSLPGLIASLKLEDCVTLIDHVPDAGTYIEKMDVLVNASEGEPFGLVLVEGMARGVPVVAVNEGGPAEFIEHGKSGLLAESGEPAALADAIESLLSDPGARRLMGKAARARYLRDFTGAATSERFFRQMERLVEPEGPRVGARS